MTGDPDGEEVSAARAKARLLADQVGNFRVAAAAGDDAGLVGEGDQWEARLDAHLRMHRAELEGSEEWIDRWYERVDRRRGQLPE